VDTLLGILLSLAMGTLLFVAGVIFARTGHRGLPAGPALPQIGRWADRYRAAADRPPGPWAWRSRLLSAAAALAATAAVWPVVQPGDPIADEMLEPAEVAVIVPVVLSFPVAWALLGRSRPYAWRVGMVLAGCVATWSLWTAKFGSYATPPNVDDGLRWYLVGTGLIVASATVVEWRRRRSPRLVTVRSAVGVLVWVVGVVATFAMPVVGEEPLPPRDSVLPLPAATTLADEEAGCTGESVFRSCVRRIRVAATDGADVRQLTRRLGEHLETRGWVVRWYDSTSRAQFPCRRMGWLNPYELCVELHTDESVSTVEVQLGYYNVRDPVIFN
jgi:hypothetical protein